MTRPKHAMEIYALLDTSNRGESGEQACLTFDRSVFQGRKGMDRCPKLDPETMARYRGVKTTGIIVDEEREACLETLRGEMADIDLAAAADRTGGWCSRGKLNVNVLGTGFGIWNWCYPCSTASRRTGCSRIGQ